MRAMLLRLGAIACSALPQRTWRDLDPYLPVSSSAIAGGVVAFLAGGVLGITGFLRHATELADAASDIWLRAGGWPAADPARNPLATLSAFSLFTFLFLTPEGWAAMYLAATGVLRAGAAALDDPVGDPILTAADHAGRRVSQLARQRAALAAREASEGPVVPDRIVSGSQAGLPAADFVIVASRQKRDWTPGTVLDTQAGYYRVGAPVECTVAGHLRTLYPLTLHPAVEVIRRCLPYQLPARTEPRSSTH